MATLRIEILNPKAEKLLQDLVDLDLIKIETEEDTHADLRGILTRIRKNAQNPPSLEEITEEVETVRKARCSSFVE